MGLKITFTQHVFSYKEDAFQMSRKSSLRTYFELCFEKCRMFDQGWTKQVFRLMNVKIALAERKSWSLWENLWRKDPPDMEGLQERSRCTWKSRACVISAEMWGVACLEQFLLHYHKAKWWILSVRGRDLIIYGLEFLVFSWKTAAIGSLNPQFHMSGVNTSNLAWVPADLRPVKFKYNYENPNITI